MPAFWEIQYGAARQSLEDWGISGLTRTRTSIKADVVTFTMTVESADIPLPFAQWSQLIFYRNGVQWFVGNVVKPAVRVSGTDESFTYEIPGPWYWIEETTFQQQWVTLDASGGAAVTMTTTRSNVILGQSLDGVKMNSGQVIAEVLRYAQYAYQGLDFPSVVGVDHLPPLPDQTKGPFRIGMIDPTITIPYTQMRDKSCADIIRLCLKYSPDCVTFFDYTTSPPTLHILRRGNLPPKTISINAGNLLEKFNPRPRYDLQVPVVIAKFESHQSSDGADYDVVTVQQYPPDVKPNTPRAWVQTIDLIGSQTTTQSTELTCQARPVAIGDEVMAAWFLKKEPWLKDMRQGDGYSGDTPMWDYTKIGFVSLTAEILDTDPLNTDNPNNVPLPDCHTLVNELLAGTVDPWLQDSQGLDAATVKVTVWTKYLGTDDFTKKWLFTYDPANPGVPKTDGTGFFTRTYEINATNADTETYSQLTSASAGEPVPVGFATYLYESLAPLHFDGDLTMVEKECSDPLPPGTTFNTTDGNPDWQTMDALVLSVSENIDTGTTSVKFGPPVNLGLGELEELRRANMGRLPSFKLDQRTSGKSSGGAKVVGARHAAKSSSSAPPIGGGGGTVDVNPFAPSDASTGTTYQIRIKAGTIGGKAVLETVVAVSAGTGTIIVSGSFSYTSAGAKTVADATLSATSAGTGDNYSLGSSAPRVAGSGTFVAAICDYNAALVNGKAVVTPSRRVSGSINFDVCMSGPSVSGPYPAP